MDPANSPVGAPTPGAVPLSCQLCRKRKIKCDKKAPCSNCVNSQKECIPVVRQRLPRGRNGGRKGVNSELRNRINRLEGLVQSLNAGLLPESGSIESTGQSVQELQAINEPHVSSLHEQTSQPIENIDAQEHTPDTSRWLGSTLWSQLSNELNGIQSILEAEDEEDNNDQDVESSPTSMTTDQSGTPIESLLFNTQSNSNPPAPSDYEIEEFCKIFQRNVDSILRFVHIPSFRGLVMRKEPYLGHPAESPAAQTLVSAAFYVSACSISNSHALSIFGKRKEELREQWRQATEQNLVRGDLIKSPSLVSLQALLLYIAALRSHKNDHESWMLISIAVRIAQAMQLHREEAYHALPFAQAELHRRSWYTLLALDYQAAMDRGSDLVVPENGYTTRFSAQDIGSEYPLEITGPPGDAANSPHVSFFAIHCESTRLLRQLNWVTPADAERPPTLIQQSWKARQDAISNLQHRLEQKYLRFGEGSDVFQFACKSFVTVLIKCAQLYAARPLQRHSALTHPPSGAVNILLLATEALEVKQDLLGEMTEPYHWLIKGYVDWHGLAVLLAELCTEYHDPQLVERAWKIADISFDKLSGQIADGTQGPLWKPLRKLMRSAQRRRQGLPILPPSTTMQEAPGDIMDAFSTHTTAAMDMSAACAPTVTNWSNEMLDPMQASWFNWQAFTDDLAQNTGFGWGVTDFDPIFGSL